MRIETIMPHGFCGGVKRAVEMAYDISGRENGRVYCLHEIVHNEAVVNDLTSKGMFFVESISDVPDGAVVMVSAHGAPKSVFDEAEKRKLKVADATCPFVSSQHAKIQDNFKKGLRTVVIGDPAHIEVAGYLGEEGACLPEEVLPGEKTQTVVQTTLDANEYHGVCTATGERQNAVRKFIEGKISTGIKRNEVGVLVIGSPKSSNTAKLSSVAENEGAASWRIDDASGLPGIDFSGIKALGVTSGASTPEKVFESVLAALERLHQNGRED